MIRIKAAMERIKPYGSKTRPIVNGYCLEGKIPCERRGNCWYIDEEFIEQAILWRQHAPVTLDQLVVEDKRIDSLLGSQKKLCWNNIRRKAGPSILSRGYALLFSGNFIAPDKIELTRNIIKTEVDAYFGAQNRILITDVAKETGISVYKLKNMIKSGELKTAKRVKENWTIEKAEVSDIVDDGGLVGIYDFCKQILPSVKTLFDLNNRSHRAVLFAFLKKSNLKGYLQTWDQAGLHGDRKNALYFPDIISDQMKQLLTEYFQHYGPAEDRLKKMATDPYWQSHKRTYEALTRFAETKITIGMVALFETIMCCISCEIMDATDEDVNRMADYAQHAPAQIYSKYLSQFLSFVKDEYEDCTFSVVLNYRSDQNRKKIIQTAPYPFHMYMSGAYLCFNQEFITEHELVKKALIHINMQFFG